MEVWDPIGVRGVPEAQDEYDAYVGPVYVMLMEERASEAAISGYLHQVATDHMGLSPVPERVAAAADAAAMIVALRPGWDRH